MFFGAWSNYLRARQYEKVNKANLIEAQRIFNENQMKQENKMTREEAIEKFYKIMYSDDNYLPDKNREWAKKAITAYEVLGLIKFDEPKSILDGRFITIEALSGAVCHGKIKEGFAFESGLNSCGYKIVKI